MPIHRAGQGDCFSTIAAHFHVASWRDLYDHPNNAALRKLRPNPGVLLPGDEVFVPEREEKDRKQVGRPTGKTHEFRVKTRLVGLRVVLQDAKDKPFAGKKYIVTVGDREIPGQTGTDGLVEVQVPITARYVTLRAWLYDDDPDDPDIEYDLLLGHLDPADTVSGIQGRLQNLGFPVTVDGVLGPQTRRAIQRFREKHGVAYEGEEPIDRTFCEALREQHGGT